MEEDMLENDYKKLIKEYEKLNESRPDIYITSYDTQILRLEKLIHDARYIEASKKKQLKLCLTILEDDRPLMKYYKAFCDNDMEFLNDVLYETAHLLQVTNILSPGTDHGFFGLNITPNLMAANMFDRLPLLLPYENGLANYQYVGTHVANLLMSVLYEDVDLKEEAKKRALNALEKKNPEYLKLHIECMMAILDKNPNEFNDKINIFCKAYLKARDYDLNAFNKGFCIAAHGMYNLAKWAYGGLMKNEIQMPSASNFCQDLAIWQEEHDCVIGKNRYTFTEELAIFNKIRESKPVIMHLIKEGKKIFLDTERYFEEYLIENGFCL